MDTPSSSESLWAEHGLTGLVLFALFALIGVFLRVISKKDESHQSFIREILTDEREERKAARQENSSNTNKLSSAIDGLAKELRNQ